MLTSGPAPDTRDAPDKPDKPDKPDTPDASDALIVIKLLFWIVLLAVIAFVLGFKRARPVARDTRRAAPATPPAPAVPEAMVSCAECGAHLPASDALPGRGGQFCSVPHRAAHEARLEAAEAARARDASSGR